MRISDLSSDVCSSDLVPRPLPHVDHADPCPGIAQGGCGGKPKPRAAARNDDSASFDLHGATPSFSIKSFVIRRLAHQSSKADPMPADNPINIPARNPSAEPRLGASASLAAPITNGPRLRPIALLTSKATASAVALASEIGRAHV